MVPGVKPLEGMPSPSPISRVLLGKAQGVEIMIGVGVAPPVAGNRMVEGGGLLIPAHGLGLAVVQVMLVLTELRPRASMTAPPVGYEDPLRMLCKMPQMLGAEDVNMLASINAGEFVTC